MNVPVQSAAWLREATPQDIEALNDQCFCVGLDNDALGKALESEVGLPGLAALLRERCPHLFSAWPVFVSREHLARMAGVVRAVESVVALPAWHETVLENAPAIARHDPGARGVFFGYDFHLSGDALGLIEINTNAGGAMLNAMLARAQRACCPQVAPFLPPVAGPAALEDAIVDMFREEWRFAGRERALARIAIVDESPPGQYLYPEFLLFEQLFRRHGMHAVIADPSELVLRDGALRYGDEVVDLVYNRLTDFALERPESAALREAYLRDAVVLTPHPRAHALYADKRNLDLLTDERRLESLGVPAATREVLLAGIPRTETVDGAHADRLWEHRRRLFFKPSGGFGSRAAYRGDKLTRRVWQEILAGGYVAQALVTPGERTIAAEPPAQTLKFDLRNYVYGGAVQWVAARLYQGQTTNFRTPGGGFAPVYAAWPR